MSNPPKSYDEIVRRTVPDLDSSYRPTKEQEHQAKMGFRAMDAEEQALCGRVHDALLGIDLERVSIEVERERVTLRGSVADQGEMRRIPELVRKIDGVTEVVDQLVVAPPGAAD